MISKTAEYALRAMVFLVDNAGESYTSDRISAATRAPVGYLGKILQQLARANLLESQRGRRGGFCATKEHEKLTLYDVVQAVDPIHRIDCCPLEIGSHGTNLCPLHATLDETLAAVERIFQKNTIGAIIRRGKNSTRPLCEFPRQNIEGVDAVRRD